MWVGVVHTCLTWDDNPYVEDVEDTEVKGEDEAHLALAVED